MALSISSRLGGGRRVGWLAGIWSGKEGEKTYGRIVELMLDGMGAGGRKWCSSVFASPSAGFAPLVALAPALPSSHTLPKVMSASAPKVPIPINFLGQSLPPCPLLSPTALTPPLPKTEEKASRDLKIRESWVGVMEARLVRAELAKCWRTEGVNHYEACHHLTAKYLDMLRENRVRSVSFRLGGVLGLIFTGMGVGWEGEEALDPCWPPGRKGEGNSETDDNFLKTHSRACNHRLRDTGV